MYYINYKQVAHVLKQFILNLHCDIIIVRIDSNSIHKQGVNYDKNK